MLEDRYYKQELLRRLQYYLEYLKEQDESNPAPSGRGVKLIEDTIKFICKE